MRSLITLVLVALLVAGATNVYAQKRPAIGLRAGIGTDADLGIAYGVGANYLVTLPNNAVELGLIVFGGSFEETTEEYNTYEETTDLVVFGVMANYLVGYRPGESSTFFVAGMGLASVSVDWEERSPNDVSLGTPLPGGGSMQSASGSAAGTVFNLGVGQSFKGGFDLRLEVPVILAFSAPGEAATVVPTVIATAGVRF